MILPAPAYPAPGLPDPPHIARAREQLHLFGVPADAEGCAPDRCERCGCREFKRFLDTRWRCARCVQRTGEKWQPFFDYAPGELRDLSGFWRPVRVPDVLTFGYEGHAPDVLAAHVLRVNGVVYDVRLSPRSALPGWNAADLAARFRDRYQSVPALGNENYKHYGKAPVAFPDFHGGIDLVLASPFPVVVVLCGCKRRDHCHRNLIGHRLADLGCSVLELAWDAAQAVFDQQIVTAAAAAAQQAKRDGGGAAAAAEEGPRGW